MNKEGLKIYSSMLSSNWMAAPVKTSIKISRRDVLLLAMFIDRGMASEETKALIGSGDGSGLPPFVTELLEKAELPADLVATLKELVAAK